MQNKALHAIHNIEDNQSIMGKVPDIEKKVKRIKVFGLGQPRLKTGLKPIKPLPHGSLLFNLGLEEIRLP